MNNKGTGTLYNILNFTTMEAKVKPFSNAKKETIKKLCDQFNKNYQELENDEILIKGEDLEGLLDQIRMKLLGQVYN